MAGQSFRLLRRLGGPIADGRRYETQSVGDANDRPDPLAARRTLDTLEGSSPGTVFTAMDSFPTVALFVSPGVERDDIVRDVLAQIEKVAELIRPLGFGAPTDAPLPTTDP